MWVIINIIKFVSGCINTLTVRADLPTGVYIICISCIVFAIILCLISLSAGNSI